MRWATLFLQNKIVTSVKSLFVTNYASHNNFVSEFLGAPYRGTHSSRKAELSVVLSCK